MSNNSSQQSNEQAQHTDYNQQEDQKTNSQKAVAGIGLFMRHRLENLGSWIDRVNHKRTPTISYRPADLSIGHDSLFRKQALKNSADIMGSVFGNQGSKFSAYSDFLKKNFPNASVDKGVDMLFAQVANLAENWSRLDIVGEKRFAKVMQMDEQERHDLAREVANQNRALATLGGATGLAGLPGLFADTIWLLIVSLRTVYQLSMVYGQPLSGKEGMKTAYSIISSSDLSKMQEKQTILAGLGIANSILANAHTQGLHQTLKSEGKKHQAFSSYVDDLDKLLEQMHIDLDKVNLSWLKKLLPVSAAAVGMHFNSILIEEIIGVTQATLAPEYKLATVEDTTEDIAA